MSRVTKFAARDPGPAARMTGFFAHLRANGMQLGTSETQTALTALTHINAANPDETRSALRAVCTGNTEDNVRFDDLFDAYWLNGGRVAGKVVHSRKKSTKNVHSTRHQASDETSDGSGTPTVPGAGEQDVESGGDGKLVASEAKVLSRQDLRYLVTPDDINEAARVAARLGRALRDRRSRRRKAARKGDQIHFRRLMRQSISTGGEPFRLPKKHRPERPLKIAALCDVSGSMTVYSKVFLAFVSGLLQADNTADAYLFHTRLVRITDALRDRDPIRAMGRLSLLADGYGGGSKIGSSLKQFARTYARRFVDGRTVVLILSDGYDTGASAQLDEALGLLKKRGCRIIWLNPLKGWQGYEPVANGMAAALQHLDLFRAANTLADLAALEPELVRL